MSMNSSWFAIDEDGCLALFQTRDFGALPASFPLVDIDSTAAEETLQFYESELAPFIAQHSPTYDGDMDEFELLVFETPKAAKEAVTAYGFRLSERNPVIVYGAYEEQSFHAFVGYAPQLWSLIAELTDLEETPYARYEFVDVSPGHYVKSHQPRSPLKVDVSIYFESRIPIKFAEHSEIQLADYFSSHDCVVRGDFDLRHQIYQNDPVPRPRKGFLSNLMKMFKKTSD